MQLNVICSLDSTVNQPRSVVQTYTHHHVWLQFAALALSLANTLNIPNRSSLNAEYTRTAGVLHMECLELLTKSLNYVSIPSEGWSIKKK